MRIRSGLICILYSLSISFFACSTGSDVAGGVSEETNSKVMCSIYNPDGSRSAGAFYKLNPAGHIPDTSLDEPFVFSGIADENGDIDIEQVEPGEYSLEVFSYSSVDSVKQYSLIRFSIDENGEVLNLRDTLRPSASMDIRLNTKVSGPFYVRGVGFNYCRRISDTAFSLHELPSGDNMMLVVTSYVRNIESADSISADLAPGKTHNYGSMYLKSSYVSDTLSLREILDSAGIAWNDLGTIAGMDSVTKGIGDLRLSDMDLASLPEGIEEFENLKSLGLQNNQLETLPGFIFTLPLEKLSAAENRLDSIPESIGGCSTLINTSFSGNEISEVPDTLFTITGLKELHINGNQIDSIQDGIGNLVNLVTLEVQNNGMEHISEGAAGLDYLSHLDVSGNSLCDVPESLGSWIEARDPDWEATQTCSE